MLERKAVSWSLNFSRSPASNDYAKTLLVLS